MNVVLVWLLENYRVIGKSDELPAGAEQRPPANGWCVLESVSVSFPYWIEDLS